MKLSASEFQVIGSATSLEFILRYGGVSSDEMVRRIEAAGRRVGHDAKYALAYFGHEPEEKEIHVTAPSLADWFCECPTTDAIYAEAKTRRLVELHPSVGLHLAELYVEQPEGEVIKIGHKPVQVPVTPCRRNGSFPHLLRIDHGDRGRAFNSCFACSDYTWPLHFRFVFGIPASHASDSQISCALEPQLPTAASSF